MIPSLYPIYAERWSSNGSVYIISDTHFGDTDCKIMNPDWITPEEQIARIRKFVHRYDTLIHLGDVGNPNYMARIPGHKVLIMGNHDQSIRGLGLYFHEVYAGPLWIGPKILLSHEPVSITPKGCEYNEGLPVAMNLHGHCHGQPTDKYIGYKNFAADVIDYTPLSLGKLIKDGLLSCVVDIHRHTIDRATARSEDGYRQMTLEEWVNAKPEKS